MGGALGRMSVCAKMASRGGMVQGATVARSRMETLLGGVEFCRSVQVLEGA